MKCYCLSKFYNKGANFVIRFTGDMNRLAPISIESKANELGVRFVSGFDFFNYRGFKMGYVVHRKIVVNETIDNTQPQSDPGNEDGNTMIQNGNGNDISAICDYVPITLPPESSGEIPVRVVGGSEAVPHEYPFMVALLMDGENFCGGSLIDQFHVLTAAHCTNGAKKLELFFGVHDMNANEEDTRQYQSVEPNNVVQHPKYDPLTSSNDIAVIRLNRKVRTNGMSTFNDQLLKRSTTIIDKRLC